MPLGSGEAGRRQGLRDALASGGQSLVEKLTRERDVQMQGRGRGLRWPRVGGRGGQVSRSPQEECLVLQLRPQGSEMEPWNRQCGQTDRRLQKSPTARAHGAGAGGEVWPVQVQKEAFGGGVWSAGPRKQGGGRGGSRWPGRGRF